VQKRYTMEEERRKEKLLGLLKAYVNFNFVELAFFFACLLLSNEVAKEIERKKNYWRLMSSYFSARSPMEKKDRNENY
jgi:hypothetical protein